MKKIWFLYIKFSWWKDLKKHLNLILETCEWWKIWCSSINSRDIILVLSLKQENDVYRQIYANPKSEVLMYF